MCENYLAPSTLTDGFQSSIDQEDAVRILDCIAEASSVVSDLPLAVVLPLYGALEAYKELAEFYS